MDLVSVVLVVIAVGCFSQTPFVAAQAAPGPFTVRVACGSAGDSYAPDTGFLWSKDFGYSGGSSGNLTGVSRIASQLNTVRYFAPSDGDENCYNISVPSGHYLLRFFFNFGQKDNSGREPEFDVSLEGTLVYSLGRGWSQSVDNEYADSLLHITDGAATACFHSSGHGSPVVASFEILQIYDDAYNLGPMANLNVIMRTVKRVTAGAQQSGYGANLQADPWGGDRYWATDQTIFTPGSEVNVVRTQRNISKFSTPPNIYPQAIYQSATTTVPMNQLSYTLPVQPNQNYSIWIHLAEIDPYVRSSNERIFNVLVNGAPLFQAVDIVKMAGGQYTALILNKTVLVEGRTLTVSFVPLAGAIAVNAFEVYQIIMTEYPTFDANVWALQRMKQTLQLPPRLGWNGDPCVPQVHPWSGVDCGFNPQAGAWFIYGLDLELQGVRGHLGDNIAALQNLQRLNMSNNMLVGNIPNSIGNLTFLTTLDLSFNRLNGSIPASIGNLPNLTELYLNDNQLIGQVPPALGALSIRGAILNLANNDGLCGIGFKSCNYVSTGAKVGTALGFVVGFVTFVVCGILCWKRRQTFTRGAQRLPRDAPYAKARTTFVRDVQMAKNVISTHFSRPPSYSERTPLNPQPLS